MIRRRSPLLGSTCTHCVPSLRGNYFRSGREPKGPGSGQLELGRVPEYGYCLPRFLAVVATYCYVGIFGAEELSEIKQLAVEYLLAMSWVCKSGTRALLHQTQLRTIQARPPAVTYLETHDVKRSSTKNSIDQSRAPLSPWKLGVWVAAGEPGSLLARRHTTPRRNWNWVAGIRIHATGISLNSKAESTAHMLRDRRWSCSDMAQIGRIVFSDR